MKIAISGSTGLVGSEFARLLEDNGHQAIPMLRTESSANSDGTEIHWDPSNGRLDPEQLEGLDAVVHLAGENIAARKWSSEQKERILQSRVQGTTLLAGALAKLKTPPTTFVSASAIGYYGAVRKEPLDESSDVGKDFLADVCKQWEECAQPAVAAGIRVVNMRIGVVLDRRGGALQKMLTPFKAGVGGKVGHGRQKMSWISNHDVVRAILFILENQELQGPVNVVSPQPVTNVEFTKALGRVLKRPTLFPLPALAVRLIFGEMGEKTILSDLEVHPKQLLAHGFSFSHPDLDSALRYSLSV